jgi:hypothetical protein
MIEINFAGPLFDGRAERAAAELAADAVEVVAETAEEHAVALMEIYFRDPTPYYWLQVTTDHPAYLTNVVHDQGVIYGPWLEGVGSRNKTSRFKGYWHWRQTRQEISSRVPELVEMVVHDRVAEMRG